MTEDDFEHKPHLIFHKDSFDFPIEYTCEAALEEGTFADSFPFSFDYEITLKDVPRGEFPTDIRRSFEWSLMWNVAIEIGLYACLFDAQGSQPTLGPRGFQVVALGSQIDDIPDTEPAGKVHSHLMLLGYTGSFLTICTLAEKDPTVTDGTCFSQNPDCIPIKGTMNAKYVGNELETQQYLLRLVEKVLGTNAVLVDGVSSLLYVGDRATFYNPSLRQPTTQPLTSASVSNQSDSGMKSLGSKICIGTAVGLGVVAIFLAGLYATRTARKKRARKVGPALRMSITSNEIDVGSIDTKEAQTSMDESLSTLCDVDAFIKEEAPSSTDNPDIADILPIAFKSVSLPSKRRRRRKKKKKRNVMGLTRSNSVNSMDTITEEDEQDYDDDGSEFGTEYSTDDDDPELQNIDSFELWSEPWDSSQQSMPLEEIVESPKIRKLPPPPV
jgi:hypothetical protein